MSDPERQNQQTITQLSAQFIHDIATPLASIQMLASLLETHLPTTLSAYQQRKAQGDEPDEIPPEELLALQASAANIKALAQQINTAAKDYWQQVDQQNYPVGQQDNAPIAATMHGISLATPLRILVAEDDEIHQKIAARLLSPPHQVDIAANGREAVDYCRRQSYDLVLMDLHMPVMDGVQATGEIMALTTPPPLIIGLTNRPLGSERKQLLQQGFRDFIEKPLRLDELQHLVENL